MKILMLFSLCLWWCKNFFRMLEDDMVEKEEVHCFPEKEICQLVCQIIVYAGWYAVKNLPLSLYKSGPDIHTLIFFYTYGLQMVVSSLVICKIFEHWEAGNLYLLYNAFTPDKAQSSAFALFLVLIIKFFFFFW